MTNDLSLGLAFTAGILSFLAPCVLPLLPGYLAYLAGTNVKEAEQSRFRVVITALWFVLGFSLVFALLGVLLNSALETIAFDVQRWASRIGGVIVVFFGVYLTGVMHVPFLEREHKVTLPVAVSSRAVSAFLFGAAFAAGWTPCAGIALGAILGLAAAQQGSAFVLLLAYALGFGLPFIALSFFVSQARQAIRRLIPLIQRANMVFGLILIVFGIMIATQTLQRYASFEILNRWLSF